MPESYNEQIELRMKEDIQQSQTKEVNQQPMFEEPIVYSSDSDDGLLPPLPVESAKPKLSLPIGGLGLSTVAQEGAITAEQMADMQTLKEVKQQKSQPVEQVSSDSDEGLPPPIPGSKPKVHLGLKLGGLGLSTLAGENGLTPE
jgi:hypothetical protein